MDRHRGDAHSYDVVEHGFNYRLDEIRAAMGLVQLRRLREENAARGRISAAYRAALDGREGVSMPFAGAEAGTSSHHLAVVLLPAGVPRNDVKTALAEAGVQSSMHYPPIHQFSRLVELGSSRPLPRTEAVAERLLTLPLYGSMSEEDVERVVTSLLAALR